MGRPKGSKNKTKRVARTRGTRKVVRSMQRNEKLSYEESVINLARCVGIPVKSGVTFGRLVNRVKRVCRREKAREMMQDNPAAYDTYVNILIKEACCDQ